MEIKGSSVPGFRDFKVDDTNLLIWEGLVVPTEVPYNKGNQTYPLFSAGISLLHVLPTYVRIWNI